MNRAVIEAVGKRTEAPSCFRLAEKDKAMTTLALVDDDENIVASLKLFFEAEGYQVRTYHDGEAALPALTETPPDITRVSSSSCTAWSWVNG